MKVLLTRERIIPTPSLFLKLNFIELYQRREGKYAEKWEAHERHADLFSCFYKPHKLASTKQKRKSDKRQIVNLGSPAR